MENKINRDNRVPGCESYTRPSEIASLSRFLKHIREVQDEHTDVDEGVVIIPGALDDLDPRVPKVDSLSDALLSILPNKGGQTSVPGHIQGERSNKIPGKIVDPGILSNTREKISRKPKDLKLPGIKEDLETPKGPDSLGTDSEKLSVKEDIPRLPEIKSELSKGLGQVDLIRSARESLMVAPKDPELGKDRRSLGETNDTPDLPGDTPRLNLSEDVQGLTETREGLNLPNDLTPGLDLSKVGLTGQGQDLTGLQDGVIGIDVPSLASELPGISEKLSIEPNGPDLPGTKPGLIIQDGPQDLPEPKDHLVTPPGPDIPEPRVGMSGNKTNPGLSEEIRELFGDFKDPGLSEKRKNISDLREVDLHDGVIGGPVETDSELPEESIHLRTGEGPDDLGDLALDLPDGGIDSSDEIKDLSVKLLKDLDDRNKSEDYIWKLTNTMYEKDGTDWAKMVLSKASSYLAGDMCLTVKRARDFWEWIRSLRKSREQMVDKKLSDAFDTDPVTGAPYTLGDVLYDWIDNEKRIRYVAENAVNRRFSGTSNRELRRTLLEELVHLMIDARNTSERKAGRHKYRLPGDPTEQPAIGKIGNIVGYANTTYRKAVSAIKNFNPKSPSSYINVAEATQQVFGVPEKILNRPTLSGKTSAQGKKEKITKYFEGPDTVPLIRTSSDPEEKKIVDDLAKEKSKGIVKKAGKLVKSIGSGISQAATSLAKQAVKNALQSNDPGKVHFKNSYLSSRGIRLTLSELSLTKNVERIQSVEELQKVLQESPWITTVNNAVSSDGWRTVRTLENNAYWEVKLYPYVGELNGFYSYLPSVREINVRNMRDFGVQTAYSEWLPFMAFELQKAKLNTRPLALYDGESTFAVSMEFTNEVRFTLTDDQYKSWRWYFEKCSEASVFSSEFHGKSHYSKSTPPLTVIDKTYACVSPMKNVTFHCMLYLMTPQFETVRKFNLLLSLRDMMEEYQGDIESSAPDLTVTFSIVGEGVPEDTNQAIPNRQKI